MFGRRASSIIIGSGISGTLVLKQIHLEAPTSIAGTIRGLPQQGKFNLHLAPASQKNERGLFVGTIMADQSGTARVEFADCPIRMDQPQAVEGLVFVVFGDGHHVDEGAGRTSVAQGTISLEASGGEVSPAAVEAICPRFFTADGGLSWNEFCKADEKDVRRLIDHHSLGPSASLRVLHVHRQASEGRSNSDVDAAAAAAVRIICKSGGRRGKNFVSNSSGTLVTLNGELFVTTLAHCIYDWSERSLRHEFSLKTHAGDDLIPTAVQLNPAYYNNNKDTAEIMREAALFHILQPGVVRAKPVPLGQGGLLPLSTELSGAGFRQGDLQLTVGLIVRVHREVSSTGAEEIQYFTDSASSMGGLSGTGLLHDGHVCGILQGGRLDTDDNDLPIRCKPSELGNKWLARLDDRSAARTLTRVVPVRELLHVSQFGAVHPLTIPSQGASAVSAEAPLPASIITGPPAATAQPVQSPSDTTADVGALLNAATMGRTTQDTIIGSNSGSTHTPVAPRSDTLPPIRRVPGWLMGCDSCSDSDDSEKVVYE